jgi:hypothetical protein
MIKNFKIFGVVYVEVGVVTIDLHNDLDLYRFDMRQDESLMEISWKPRMKSTWESHLRFSFNRVKRVALAVDILSGCVEDYKTLAFIGYLPPEDFGVHDRFMGEEAFSPDKHVVFAFENGSFISIEAEECELDVYSQTM